MNLLHRRSAKKNLIYTVIFDAPGSENYRFLGKMLVSSLLKTFFTGDIVIFRNSPAPLYLVERKGLDEVFLETPTMIGQARAEYSWCWKYKVSELIEHPEQYDKILFLDADSLVLRNIDHLLEGDWDIRYQVERGKPLNGRRFNAFLTEEEMFHVGHFDGVNSGTIAVRGSIFHDVMEEWANIDEMQPLRESGYRDQASWNALLTRKTDRFEGENLSQKTLQHSIKGEKKWKAEPFPIGEVSFPGYLNPHYIDYTRAALTHNILPDSKEKVEFTFGLYMRTFYCDPTGLFFSMIEI